MDRDFGKTISHTFYIIRMNNLAERNEDIHIAVNYVKLQICAKYFGKAKVL